MRSSARWELVPDHGELGLEPATGRMQAGPWEGGVGAVVQLLSLNPGEIVSVDETRERSAHHRPRGGREGVLAEIAQHEPERQTRGTTRPWAPSTWAMTLGRRGVARMYVELRPEDGAAGTTWRGCLPAKLWRAAGAESLRRRAVGLGRRERGSGGHARGDVLPAGKAR